VFDYDSVGTKAEFPIKARQLWANPSLIPAQLSSDFAAICPRGRGPSKARSGRMYGAIRRPQISCQLGTGHSSAAFEFIHQWPAFSCRQI